MKATRLEFGNGSPATYCDLAVEADRSGIESLWMGHHVVLGSEVADEYPYTADGVVPLDAAGDRYDPWVLFAHLGALTRRLRFGTAVYLLPMINPFITARAVASADQLTGGRIILGIGVGWSRQEYANLGAAFDDRGERADEIIEILHRLWTRDSAIEFSGRHYSFDPVEMQPKPHQRPGPPIMYGGGDSDRVLRRAAGLQGFIFPPNVDLATIEQVTGRIHRFRDQAGRSSEPYELTAIIEAGLTLDHARRLADLGVGRVVFEAARWPLDPDGPWLPTTSAALCSNVRRVVEHLQPIMTA